MSSLGHGHISLTLVRNINYAHCFSQVSEEYSHSSTQANLNLLQTVFSNVFIISEMPAYIHENYQYSYSTKKQWSL